MKTDNEYLDKAEELITIFHNLRYDGLNDVRDAVACEAPAGRAISVGFGAIAYNEGGI